MRSSRHWSDFTEVTHVVSGPTSIPSLCYAAVAAVISNPKTKKKRKKKSRNVSQTFQFTTHTYWQSSSYSKGQSQDNQDNFTCVVPFPSLTCDSHAFIHDPLVYNAYLPILPPWLVQPTGVIYVASGRVTSYPPPKQ